MHPAAHLRRLRDGGAWFHCPDCGRAGDLIELAAAVWGMGLAAALDKLATSLGIRWLGPPSWWFKPTLTPPVPGNRPPYEIARGQPGG